MTTTVDASGGAGGLAARYDEDHWISLEARGTVVTARAQIAGLTQTWQATVPAADVELRMEMTPPPAGFNSAAMGGDRIRLLAAEVAARYPVLIAAAFYTAADEDLDFLIDYAQAGGHLVVGPRTGYGDGEGRARTQRAPARITEAAGVWYDEIASLPSPVPAVGSLRGAATGVAEGLVASDAEVLASYQHPHLGRWAAVTTKPAGAGRITVIGTVPDQDLAAGLVRWLVPDAVDGWTTDDSVTVSTSTDASAATRLHVLHNWSWDEATASPSGPVTDIPGGERRPPGKKITLRAWDVRLFRGGLPERLAETQVRPDATDWSGAPCTKGGECLHRGLLSELPIVLGSDVLVGEPAEVTPHRLSAVAVAVEEP